MARKYLRLYQVGNTSSRKNTEVKPLGPRLALRWVTIQGLDVDAVATKYCKSLKRPPFYVPEAKQSLTPIKIVTVKFQAKINFVDLRAIQ